MTLSEVEILMQELGRHVVTKRRFFSERQSMAEWEIG